jgi:protein gp37
MRRREGGAVMGKNTTIGWTDSTINFWLGCTYVSDACTNCYAHTISKRFGGAEWGAGKQRIRTSQRMWDEPLKWHNEACKTGIPRKVFCSSMSDFFDNEIDPAWRDEAWEVIRKTKWLRWQILTKRIGNVQKMLPVPWVPGAYTHVGIMATIANQEEANRDLPKLLALKQGLNLAWVGVSVEPMLGPVDLEHVTYRDDGSDFIYNTLSGNGSLSTSGRFASENLGGAPRLDWVIIGGESGKGPAIRTFEMADAYDLIQQCKRAGVPCFLKQMGTKPVLNGDQVNFKHWKGEAPEEWPAIFRVQEFPHALVTDRCGVAA